MSKRLSEMPRPTHTVRIGRAQDNGVSIQDPSVSGQHAVLQCFPGDKYFLLDCRSRNGTFVTSAGGDTRRVSQEWVAKEDMVVFGSCSFPVHKILEYGAIRESTSAAARGRADQLPQGQSTVIERCSCGNLRKQGARCMECGN